MDSQLEFPDGPVFHYTSQRGLLGIISSKSIWATNILYMNDAAELQYAVDLASQQIALFNESASKQDPELLGYIEEELTRITRMRPDGIYVCSFSIHGDQLSQWRGYCPAGNGYSVGIDLPKFQNAMIQQGFRAAKCVYKPYEEFELIKRFLSESLERLRKLATNGEVDQDTLDVASTMVGLNFLQLAATIKHEKFSEEDEWRLISRPISFDDPRLRFREGKSTIIPYVEFKLAGENDHLIIEKLYIGPTPHKDLALKATLQLLFANGIEECSAEISEVRYRTW